MKKDWNLFKSYRRRYELQGYFINLKTVRRLMHACGIKFEIRRHKYRSYKGSIGKVAPNILNRKRETV